MGKPTKRKRGKKFVWNPTQDQAPKTLAEGYKQRFSANVFKDRRIGEKSKTIDREAKFLARFQKEREFLSKKRRKFDLDDEITLTHHGVPVDNLSDDYVDEDRYDSERSDNEYDKLDDEIVEQEHFGEGNQDDNGEPKTRREIYAEIIAKSKYNKMIRQQTKEDDRKLMESLDANLDELTAKLKPRVKEAEDDEYDRLIAEIKREGKVRPYSAHQEEIKRAEQTRKELDELGDFSLPDDFHEFARRVVEAEDPADYLDKVMIWNCKVLSTSKPMEVLAFLVKFLVTGPDAFIQLHYMALCKAAYHLCAIYPALALDCFGTSVTSLPGDITAKGVLFTDLTGMICDVHADSTLRSIVHSFLAVQYLTSSVSDPATWANMLRVHWERWLDNGKYYSPEWAAGLLKLAEATSNSDQTEVQRLTSLARDTYSKYPGFNVVLDKLTPLLQETVQRTDYTPLLLKPQVLKEIESLEPVIVRRISTVNKVRDPNKQHTDTRALKAELKKSKKSARKVLTAESAVIRREKQREADMLTDKRKLIRHRAFQAVEESEREIKLMKTEVRPKRVKKEKMKRMAGSNMEQH